MLAVVVLVFAAYFCAGLADLGAKLAQSAGVLAFHRHELCGKATERRALHIKADTAAHHVDIGFIEAGYCAVVTGFGAKVAGVNTSAQIVLHASLLFYIRHY